MEYSAGQLMFFNFSALCLDEKLRIAVIPENSVGLIIGYIKIPKISDDYDQHIFSILHNNKFFTVKKHAHAGADINGVTIIS